MKMGSILEGINFASGEQNPPFKELTFIGKAAKIKKMSELLPLNMYPYTFRLSLFRLFPQAVLSLYVPKTKKVEFANNIDLGPVVQSIVSLTNSLRGQLVKCFMTYSQIH